MGLLVEAFPAAQLHHWQLPHKGYDGSDGGSERETIIVGISPRVEMPTILRARCQESADALDSVLCLFAARAAVAGLAPVDDTTAAELEGWDRRTPAISGVMRSISPESAGQFDVQLGYRPDSFLQGSDNGGFR